jgi:hypothetical protein
MPFDLGKKKREGYDYEPDMLVTELLTLLSQPSQSIFTFISTVYKIKSCKKENQNFLKIKLKINTHA